MTARVLVIEDPTGATPPEVHRLAPGASFGAWMLEHWPASRLGGRTATVARHAEPGSVAEPLPDPGSWDFAPDDGEAVALVVCPAGPVALNIAISIAISLALTALQAILFPPEPAPSYARAPKPNPTFDLAIPSNQSRPGEAVPVHYGRRRVVPDYATQPYRRFEANRELVEVLFCVTAGSAWVYSAYAGDTSLDDLPEGVAEWRVFGPDDHDQVHGRIAAEMGFWGEDVVTSPEVGSSGLELIERTVEFSRAFAVEFIAPATIRIRTSAEAVDADDFAVGEVITIASSASNNGGHTIAARTPASGYVDFDVSSGIADEGIPATLLRSFTDADAVKQNGGSENRYELREAPIVGSLGLAQNDIVRITCSTGAPQYAEVKSYAYTAEYSGSADDSVGVHTLVVRRIGGALNAGAALGTVAVYAVDPVTVQLGASAEWRGWFLAAKSGQAVTRIALDFEARGGIYKANDTTGELEDDSVSLRIQVQEVDDDGDPVGDRVTTDVTLGTSDLPAGDPKNTAIRKTIELTGSEGVEVGQYRVRVRRTSAPSDNAGDQSAVVWSGMKARRPLRSGPVYGRTTLMACRFVASEGLSGDAIQRVSVDQHRQLPAIRETRNDAQIGRTRNIGRAIYDMATDVEYGLGLGGGETFDIAELQAADGLWEAAGLTFDHGYADRSTLWGAMRIAAAAGLAEPLAYAGKVHVAQNGPKTAPTQVFTPLNTTGLKVDFGWDRERDIDGVRIVYRDQTSQLEKTAIWPDDAVTPTEVQAWGVTDDAVALDLAKIRWRQRVSGQVLATWETELAGRIPRRGDMVEIAHPLMGWSDACALLVAVDGRDLTLDRDVLDGRAVGDVVYVKLRDSDGEPTGWLGATWRSPTEVRLDGDAPITLRTLGSTGEPTHVLVATAADTTMQFVIDTVETAGPFAVRLSGRRYVEGAFSGTFAAGLET